MFVGYRLGVLGSAVFSGRSGRFLSFLLLYGFRFLGRFLGFYSFRNLFIR